MNNQETMLRWYEALCRGDVEYMMHHVRSDVVYMFPYNDMTLRGREEMRNFYETLLKDIAEFNGNQWDAKWVQEGDTLVVFIKATATGRKTGKSASVDIVHRVTFQDGQIAELWELIDTNKYWSIIGDIDLASKN